MIDFSAYPPLVDDVPDDLDEDAFAKATALVRRVCGWHIAPSVTEELIVDSDGGTILSLPSLHVTEVVSVTDADGVAIEGFGWSPMGLVERGTRWPKGYRAVKVTLAHGLPACPGDLAELVIAVAQSLPTEDDSVEVIGPFQFAASMGLDMWTKGHAAALSRYQLP